MRFKRNRLIEMNKNKENERNEKNKIFKKQKKKKNLHWREINV